MKSDRVWIELYDQKWTLFLYDMFSTTRAYIDCLLQVLAETALLMTLCSIAADDMRDS